MRHTLFFTFLLTVTCIVAQQNENDSILEREFDSIYEYYVRFEGDSILRSSIELDDVYVFGKLEFADRK